MFDEDIIIWLTSMEADDLAPLSLAGSESGVQLSWHHVTKTGVFAISPSLGLREECVHLCGVCLFHLTSV